LVKQGQGKLRQQSPGTGGTSPMACTRRRKHWTSSWTSTGSTGATNSAVSANSRLVGL